MAITTPRPWLASYAEGVPHDVDAAQGSLYDLIRSSVEQYPDNVALEFFERTTTYAELGAEIERVAEGPGWYCYAQQFDGTEILVGSLGLIPQSRFAPVDDDSVPA